MSVRKNIHIVALVSLILASYAVFGFGKHYLVEDRLLRLKVYDVGQGDSIFINTPLGQHILVDGGPNSKSLSLLLKDLPPGPCRLDLLVLTHPHNDHLSGLNDVMRFCSIDLLLTTGHKVDTKVFQKWLSLVDEASRSGRLKSITKPTSFETIDFGNLRLKVLWPVDDSWASQDNTNNDSIVLLISYGGFDALLTGDAEKDVLEALRLNKDRGIEVLKVSHHGSIDGLNKGFLSLVKPLVSVISVGKGNKYNHPSPITVRYLESLGSKVFRTDLSGTVMVSTDGNFGFTVNANNQNKEYPLKSY